MPHILPLKALSRSKPIVYKLFSLKKPKCCTLFITSYLFYQFIVYDTHTEIEGIDKINGTTCPFKKN